MFFNLSIHDILGNMSFQVKTTYFEGPLELLLSLIEGKKLHVSEISLAEVTNEYLTYINPEENQTKNNYDTLTPLFQERSKFLNIASTLVLIKARSLLPSIVLTTEEEVSIDDLTERLRIYEIIKQHGELFSNQLQRYPVMYRGTPSKEKKQPIFSPHSSITQHYLLETLYEIFATLPTEHTLPEKSVKTTITLAQVMEKVTQAVHSGISYNLKEATDQYKSAATPREQREAKVYAVLSFLAILEMIKKAVINVEQSELFDDIIAHPYQELPIIES